MFMNDSHELPDRLLLQAVDIILADRQSESLRNGRPDVPSSRESLT
jgi:hypothetical protein